MSHLIFQHFDSVGFTGTWTHCMLNCNVGFFSLNSRQIWEVEFELKQMRRKKCTFRLEIIFQLHRRMSFHWCLILCYHQACRGEAPLWVHPKAVFSFLYSSLVLRSLISVALGFSAWHQSVGYTERFWSGRSWLWVSSVPVTRSVMLKRYLLFHDHHFLIVRWMQSAHSKEGNPPRR